ncbi:MAG: FAD-dependent oxidoreductase [Deltaproteobacteria bacterium]|nr:FAD-dependent oxidoreductase [Deltaproteobacteria bacterium]
MSDATLLSIPPDDVLQAAFAKQKPRLSARAAHFEASRCLFCHDAPCVQACPTGIDIPMFIRQIMSGDAMNAAKTIFTQNILGRSCADVCPTEVLCEGACVYNALNRQPIEIGRLQGYATNLAITQQTRFFTKGRPTGQRVAIVGGGPAGLACAHELCVLGYEPVVFEASAEAGGLNAYGVAPYKYSNEESRAEVAYLAQIGFEIRTNTRLTAAAIATLELDFAAIFLGIGLSASRRLGIPGETLPGVVGAAEFIYRLREQAQRIAVGRRVVVIGAGNTAIDAAVEAAKLGAEVQLAYRRTAADQSAYTFEVELAQRHGVRFEYLTSPVAILGTDCVTGVRWVRNTIDGHGRASAVHAVAGSEFVTACDQVICATGQEKQRELFAALDLALERDKVLVNADFQASRPQYFAGGDCVNGGKEVVNAVAHGRDAARGIDRFLKHTKI